MDNPVVANDCYEQIQYTQSTEDSVITRSLLDQQQTVAQLSDDSELPCRYFTTKRPSGSEDFSTRGDPKAASTVLTTETIKPRVGDLECIKPG
jgi:hypothetical protein